MRLTAYNMNHNQTVPWNQPATLTMHEVRCPKALLLLWNHH